MSTDKEPFSVTRSEKTLLLGIARRTVESVVRTGRPPRLDPSQYTGICLRHCGAFVTLHQDGDLRGCIGMFEADAPLWQTIREMAEAAAFRDPRFPPVREADLTRIDFEISVLSPLRKVSGPGEIVLGRDGIYIRKGSRSGTFLPQVARETGWSLEEFLGHCSRDKAGIGWDGWKTAELSTYTAEVFGEKDPV
jgi:AmmeMemoRadiSam system protein A